MGLDINGTNTLDTIVPIDHWVHRHCLKISPSETELKSEEINHCHKPDSLVLTAYLKAPNRCSVPTAQSFPISMFGKRNVIEVSIVDVSETYCPLTEEQAIKKH